MSGLGIKNMNTEIKYYPNGRHVVLDIWGCTFEELNDVSHAIKFIMQVVKDADMHMLNMSFKKFEPQGLTVIGLLSESHISIHTYPEHGYAAIDLFTCGDNSTPVEAIEKNLPKFFTLEQVSSVIIERGKKDKPFGRTISSPKDGEAFSLSGQH